MFDVRYWSKTYVEHERRSDSGARRSPVHDVLRLLQICCLGLLAELEACLDVAEERERRHSSSGYLKLAVDVAVAVAEGREEGGRGKDGRGMSALRSREYIHSLLDRGLTRLSSSRA